MGQKRGQTGNPFGRKAGVPNKLTFDMRETLKTILENEIKILPQLLEKMNPEKRADILSKLLQYVTPKIQNVELTGADGKDFLPARTLTKEEAREYIQKIEDEC
jgi:hypothetical protein